MKQSILIGIGVFFILLMDGIAQESISNNTQKIKIYQDNIEKSQLKVKIFKQALKSKDIMRIKKAAFQIQLDPIAIQVLNKENIFIKKKWNDNKHKEENLLTFPKVLSSLTHFREDGYKNPVVAFAKYADKKTAINLQALGSVFTPDSNSSQAWKLFFGTSVAAISSLSEKIVLTMLYNPWTDIALLCEWTKLGDMPKITQVKLICGDEIRSTEIPVLLPLWQREANIPPQLSIVVATSDTVQAFLNLYGMRPTWRAKEWADNLPPLKTDNPKEDSKKIASLFFNQNLFSINTFFEDTVYRELKISMEKVREQLIAGKIKEILKTTPETIKESRTVLHTLTSEAWNRMTMVSFSKNAKSAIIFLSNFSAPQVFISFWFNMDNTNHATLRRIDVFKFDLSFKEVDKLARKVGIKRAKLINFDKQREMTSYKKGGDL